VVRVVRVVHDNCMSPRFQFCIMMSATLSSYNRCSVCLCYYLSCWVFICYLCLRTYSGDFHIRWCSRRLSVTWRVSLMEQEIQV